MKIYSFGLHNEFIKVPEEHMFLGVCKGIALVPRGKKDNHVCFLVLTEDDGTWFCSKNSSSSFWMDDLATQLNNALRWLKENAIKEVYGYRFRS